MELSEKIQKLRKERGLTQEQFAEQLFVSRTAVSKWETGRGIPSMESLQMIAKFFGISLDALLSIDEIIPIAKNENNENMYRFAVHIDGLFNIGALIGVLLPLYKAEIDRQFFSVPLYQFTGWLAIPYWIFSVAIVLCGIVQILLCKSERDHLKQAFKNLALVLNIGAIVLLILSGQPYPAVVFFALLLAKGATMYFRQK